jgi:hypothetical protein
MGNIFSLNKSNNIERYIDNIESYIDKEYKFDELWNEKCSEYMKQPYIIPAVKRIIVIGDVHGDLMMTQKTLKIAKLIDNNCKWIGGDTILVQLGDQIDRCRMGLIKESCVDKNASFQDEGNDYELLNFFIKLNMEAFATNGAVYSLLGNHELMNVDQNFRYVSHQGFLEFNKPNVKKIINPKLKQTICDKIEELKISSELKQKIYNKLIRRNISPELKQRIHNELKKLKNSLELDQKNIKSDELNQKIYDKLDQLNIIPELKQKIHDKLNQQNISLDQKQKIYDKLNQQSIILEQNYLEGRKIRGKVFAKGQYLSQLLACTRPVSIIIGSNLFVHGGIIPQIANRYSITSINKILTLYLLNKLKNEDINKYKDIFDPYISPLWNRDFGKIGMEKDKSNTNDYRDEAHTTKCQELLQPLNDIYKIGKIYVAHTPMLNKGMTSVCQNKVWLTDYGLSRAFDDGKNKRKSYREPHALEILNDGEEINILRENETINLVKNSKKSKWFDWF